MRWIDEIVLGLLELYMTSDPYEICDILNIDIEKTAPNNSMLQNKNSVYFRNFCEREIIYIRDDLNLSYERFYLRHELGHAILHTYIMCSYPNDLVNYNKIEKQANYFAFKLSGITFRKEELRDMSLSQVASILEFPEAVLRNIIPERVDCYGS